MSLLKIYGKVDESDQDWFAGGRRKMMRKRICVISLICVILVLVTVSAVVGTCISKRSKSDSKDQNSDQSEAASLKAACGVTLYPDSCFRSLAPLLSSSGGALVQPQSLYKASLQVAISELSNAAKYFVENDGLTNLFAGNKTVVVAALKNCRELIDLATDHLNSSFLSDRSTLFEAVEDVVTWLSAAGTYQETCIDGFSNTTLRPNVLQYLKDSTEFTSNSLAIIKQISNAAKSLNLGRKLLTAADDDTDMPHWLSVKERKLLQSWKPSPIKYDAVVAKDRTGQYKTIGDALKAVPEKSKKRFSIYVKAGVYYENVRVEKGKWNVMMVGDGMDKTIVSGSLNVVDGTPTFSSATFAAFGQGFIARDMGFRNTAGPIKHQAVALMSNSDRSVFYRCRFDAFQDTLYVHANRQFYRECDIYGTVDFIFGNSAVVIQNCKILPRKPLNGQQNTITAQGKIDPNQNTGISIQNCTILPLENLGAVQTFLGRPWKNYSTTIIMNTMIGSLVDAKGWLPWTGTSAPDTIFYAEYWNMGPGSSTKYRVKWKGLRSITAKQASKFTVGSFINGSQWIKDAGVDYNAGL